MDSLTVLKITVQIFNYCNQETEDTGTELSSFLF